MEEAEWPPMEWLPGLEIGTVMGLFSVKLDHDCDANAGGKCFVPISSQVKFTLKERHFPCWVQGCGKYLPLVLGDPDAEIGLCDEHLVQLRDPEYASSDVEIFQEEAEAPQATYLSY